ncbi:helix-turn-helix domain-containing protein [Alloalcanivorax xenomutans]|uniref:helix-turn-helix domain-containing protein n=1 Tax=Alloalcanivorax xenomutans TaxID=1094342 RepID=UPI0035A8D734
MVSTVGDKIFKLRKQKGLTLEQLANKANCSKSYVWELENRNPPRPSAEKLSSLGAALGVTIDYFVDGEVNEEDATDRMFYREYRRMAPEVKEKIRQMVDLWKDE